VQITHESTLTMPPISGAASRHSRTASSRLSARGRSGTPKIKLLIYDRLSPSRTVRAQLGEARAHGILVVGVSAVLTPVTATFQQWQAGEVTAVARALAAARSR
jgi:hypothetical protein